jgi:class 3 adenylate cyclase
LSDQSEQQSSAMKLAHVLFTDIVGYSKLPIDQQTKSLQTLQQIVQGTAEVARAQASDQLISIATGDGMALVFFNDPMAPVQCALEISRALKGHPQIKLRMGVHSGPVDEMIDVNNRKNVAGSGINMAQRVMDSGDAGHILLSRRVAEDLGQYSTWQPFLHDLKEVEVKHGVRMHVFNLYTGEAGNAALPASIRKRQRRSLAVPSIAGGAVVLIVIAVFVFWWRGRNAEPVVQPVRAEAESVAVLGRKTDEWMKALFAAQGASGGLRSSPSGSEASAQVWTTAQGLTAILATQKNLDTYVPQLKRAFESMEKGRRTTPTEGWSYHANANPYTVTEINGWVTVAEIKSLDTPTKIWSDEERATMVKRVLRDLEETKRRQDKTTGGFRPIRDDGQGFTRTYSTVVALWSLLEARKSPAVSAALGTQSDGGIREGINWLLRTYKEGQGWVQNPNRSGRSDNYHGLTAHALFVLAEAATIPDFAYLKNDQIYRNARKDLINDKQLATLSIEKDNSHIPDADVSFEGTDFMAEGSTFLWFPWVLLELTELSSDASLSAAERASAVALRRNILNVNFERLDSYVESADLTYLFAENLFCVSQYVNAMSTSNGP